MNPKWRISQYAGWKLPGTETRSSVEREYRRPNSQLLGRCGHRRARRHLGVGQWAPIEHNAPVCPLIEHWNGTKWSVVPAPRSPGYATRRWARDGVRRTTVPNKL